MSSITVDRGWRIPATAPDPDQSPSVEQRDAMHRAELVRRLVELGDALELETPPSREVDLLQCAVCELIDVVESDREAGLVTAPAGDWF